MKDNAPRMARIVAVLEELRRAEERHLAEAERARLASAQEQHELAGAMSGGLPGDAWLYKAAARRLTRLSAALQDHDRQIATHEEARRDVARKLAQAGRQLAEARLASARRTESRELGDIMDRWAAGRRSSVPQGGSANLFTLASKGHRR